MKRILILLFILGFSFINAQAPNKKNSVEIYQSIQKLNFLGTVLYLAAHPDDENTRMISYFSNRVHARTAYLSLTRGDGGQNLIGPEIRELLGVIRTNELLQARRVDEGEQFFARANDFGYSKHPDETLEFWNKKEVLSDVVRIIRTFRPDIVINRFNTESAGKTHGHHTASAMLSTEAFDLSADKNYKTENLPPWKINSMFFNTSWWFYGSKEKFNKADKSKMLSIDTGVYFPSSGLSNTEIASLSRSMHKSQGFGSTGSRGSEKEYLELIKGTMPTDRNNIFEEINTSWTRVKGGEKIKIILEDVEHNFDFNYPSASIPDLLKAYSLIINLEDTYWRDFKSKQIKEIIADCAGLYMEVISNVPNATPGDVIDLKTELINRSQEKIFLKSYSIHNGVEGSETHSNKSLENNKRVVLKDQITIPKTSTYSTPYWLNKKGSLGMYQVDNLNLIGLPMTPINNFIVFNVNIDGTDVSFKRIIKYKYNDPVKGEVYRPFEIIPAITSRIASNVIIFNEDTPKEIPVQIIANKDNVKGMIKLKLPVGWSVSPQEIVFDLSKKEDEKKVVFVVTPTKEQSEGTLEAIIVSGKKIFTKTLFKIDYDHIPRQSVLLPSTSRIVRLNLVKKGNTIGYIKGAGDEVPKYLQQIGYKVNIIEPSKITDESLSKYDAIMVGIRAYNTVEDLKHKQEMILNYVKNGGNLIVQYNTSHRLLVKDNLAPYKLRLSRDRVTDENAEVKFLAPKSEVLNYPNKITKHDFDGWVQERGLYFPDKWGKEFVPILSFHDKGESPKKGSLLIAKYGKGYYMYTGLSFFRELPAGVPGAYKLLTNMISIGKNDFEKKINK